MNCRPGDLAIIVRSDPLLLNEGVIVRVRQWAEARAFINAPSSGESGAPNVRAGWICEGRHRQFGRYTDGGWRVVEFDVAVIPDDLLRPLRDNDGQDETLRVEYTKGAA